MCTEAPTSTINVLSSGFTVEVDATLHSIFGGEECSFVLQVGSATCVQCVGSFRSCFSCIVFCPQRVIWISVSKRGRAGAAMMLSTTLDNSKRWSRWFPIVGESFCSFRIFEFEVYPWRSLAALLQDGPSHVRGSNPLFWLFDVLRCTTHFLIAACNSGSDSFFDSLAGVHCGLNEETHICHQIYNLRSPCV